MTGEEYELLPKQIKNVVDSFDDSDDRYDECRRIHYELARLGWTCDYGLDGCIYNVRKA